MNQQDLFPVLKRSNKPRRLTAGYAWIGVRWQAAFLRK